MNMGMSMMRRIFMWPMSMKMRIVLASISMRMKIRMMRIVVASISMRIKMRMMRIVLASISQPLNCGSAGVPSGMRPSVCKMDTMMEKVAMMMKMIRTSWDVGRLRHMIVVAFS